MQSFPDTSGAADDGDGGAIVEDDDDEHVPLRIFAGDAAREPSKEAQAGADFEPFSGLHVGLGAGTSDQFPKLASAWRT